MLSFVVVPGGNENTHRDYASSNVLESYQIAWQENQQIFANTALKNLSTYSLNQGAPVTDVENSSEQVLITGRFNGTTISNYTFENWEARSQNLAVDRNFNISSQLQNISVQVKNLTVSVKSTLKIEFADRFGQSTHNETFYSSKPVENVKDPYLASRGYSARFNYCGFSKPVSTSLTVSTADYNGTAYGQAVVAPETSNIGNQIGRVLVTPNPSNYTSSETDGFAAVITNQASISSSYNTVYASNVNISSIEASDSLIVHEGQVYRSYFRKIISDSCYIPVSGYPGIEERFANNTVSYSGSVATFINETKISTDTSLSSVGYEYFNNGTVGNLVEVAGLSYGRGNTLPWFRISNSISQKLGITGLTDKK